MNPAHIHGSFSYPSVYPLVVLPLSVTRWLQFTHKNVPSVALFFGVSMFNLSGTLDVLLLLVVRPQLLLFARPEERGESQIELGSADPEVQQVLH